MPQPTPLALRPLALFVAAMLATCVLVDLGACGYRPAGSLLDDEERVALVPAFESSIPYPELDVYAGSYLSSRLTTMGVRPTSNPSVADWTVQGYLLSARERPVVLGGEQTLVELIVDVRVDVRQSSGDDVCATSTSSGRTQLPVPLGAISEGERHTALQHAASEAIEALLLETVLCLSDASREDGSNQDERGDPATAQ